MEYVTWKRVIDVFGGNSCIVVKYCPRSVCKSHAKYLISSRMIAPWLTTRISRSENWSFREFRCFSKLLFRENIDEDDEIDCWSEDNDARSSAESIDDWHDAVKIILLVNSAWIFPAEIERSAFDGLIKRFSMERLDDNEALCLVPNSIRSSRHSFWKNCIARSRTSSIVSAPEGVKWL